MRDATAEKIAEGLKKLNETLSRVVSLMCLQTTVKCPMGCVVGVGVGAHTKYLHPNETCEICGKMPMDAINGG